MPAANASTRIIGDRIASFWAKVDKTESCWNWTAGKHEAGYGVFATNRGEGKWRTVRAHRMSWELLRGPITAGAFLDHICHNRACVNPDHLREVTNKQNIENHSGPTSNNKTGFRGVYWCSRSRRYRFQVRNDGKRHSGGHYLTAEEANEAAVALRNELHTHNDLDRTTKKAA